jgi:hypothetical protein
MFRVLLALSLSLCLLSPLSAHEKRALSKQHLELSTDYGKVILEDITVQQSSDVLVLVSGTISNQTDRNWRSISLVFQFKDKSGGIMQAEEGVSNSVYIAGLPRTETRKFERAIAWREPARQRVSDFDVVFDMGNSQYDLEYSLSLIKPKESGNLKYEDDLLGILFSLTEDAREIAFSLQNKSDAPIEVGWDQSAFVDFSGKSHRVIHVGTKLADRDKAQAPTIVPPTARIEDMVYPADFAEWNGGEWLQSPTLPVANPSYKGQMFSVFLVLKVTGETKNYLFTFKVADVHI